MGKKGMWEKAKAGNDRIGTIYKKSQTSFGIRLFAEFLVPQVPERFDKGTSKSSYAAQVRGFGDDGNSGRGN
jgi:hypothetical protein